MAKSSMWKRVKTKFNRKKREEFIQSAKIRSRKIALETRLQFRKQMFKAQLMVRRLRTKDKRDLPLFMLTFNELEDLMKTLPENTKHIS